jgi:dipeptidyl aminopeptidase/acylaminoacyl peptidase
MPPELILPSLRNDGAPPLFIAVASDDQAVGWQGSVDLYSAWHKANIPVELHVFQTGRHGFTKKGGADHYFGPSVRVAQG